MVQNKEAFFRELRARLFGGKLTQRQVDGVEHLLAAMVYYGVSDPDHGAYVLANVHRETGGGMYPVKETVYAYSKDQNPSDATVKQRLTTAFNKGQLPWVKTPYWKDGWFGRGQIQLTHKDNYVKFAQALGIAIDVGHGRDLALDPAISSRIAVLGMRDGMFTGKRLSDYVFPEDTVAPPAHNPRRIVNGNDGSDKEVAGFYRAYKQAILAGGVAAVPASTPPPATTAPIVPEPAPSYTLSFWDRVKLFFARVLGH